MFKLNGHKRMPVDQADGNARPPVPRKGLGLARAREPGGTRRALFGRGPQPAPGATDGVQQLGARPTFLYKGTYFLWGYSPDRQVCGLWNAGDPAGPPSRSWPISEHEAAWQAFRSTEPYAVEYAEGDVIGGPSDEGRPTHGQAVPAGGGRAWPFRSLVKARQPGKLDSGSASRWRLRRRAVRRRGRVEEHPA
jgi:hypothetical protein